MNHDDRLREALRQAIPRMGDQSPRRDLWPDVLRQLDHVPVRVSWLDWALIAALSGLTFIFPDAIPGVLYHL
jgi:hypothetical protein